MDPSPELTPSFVLYTSASRDARHAAVRPHLDAAGRGSTLTVDARTWLTVRDVVPGALEHPDIVWIRDLHEAFPSGQTPGTRLVLTQAAYQLQRWFDWIAVHPDTTIVADADPRLLWARESAGRGPWAQVAIVPLAEQNQAVEQPDTPGTSPATGEVLDLPAAFSQPDAARRLDACAAAVRARPADAPALLALASVCMELQLLDDAADALAQAALAEPAWEAVHFETGKLHLRRDDTAAAADAFAAAARLMPTFAGALGNLGAALCELEREEEGLAALERGLALDPNNVPLLNNAGAAARDLARLDDAAGYFERALLIDPRFVFGHYNLGHVRLLQGRFADAARCYDAGAERDPQQNPRQAVRRAVAQAAAGQQGAGALVREAVLRLPPAQADAALLEAEETLAALQTIDGGATADVAELLETVRATREDARRR